jgi:hypothetical protein
LRLARLYSGHAIRGFHIALRASALGGTAETNLAVALMWASVAANNGVEDAIALRDDLTEQATSKERAMASTLLKDWRSPTPLTITPGCKLSWANSSPPAAASRLIPSAASKCRSGRGCSRSNDPNGHHSR